jgi:hypothetical protein
MDKILGGITSLTPIQRDGQDEIIAEWRIGDPNPFSGIDVRMCIDLPTLKKLEDAMKYSNCGIVYMNRLCWRVSLRKDRNGKVYTLVKYETMHPVGVSVK